MSNTSENMNFYTLDEVTDKYIGERGTAKREAFEHELQMEVVGNAIRQARLERNLTQEQLGKLIGVQKAQISKIENSLTNARFDTILKVFKALEAKINFKVELLNKQLQLV